MIIRRVIAPLAVALVTLHSGQAAAQDASPAPLPNQPAAPPANASPFPPGNAASVMDRFAKPPISVPSEICMKEFVPLREDAEKRGKLIKAAADRKVPPDEACKLIASYGEAETRMIKFIEANAAKCAIPPQVADQVKAGHKNTEALQQKVCDVAQQIIRQQRSPGGLARINHIGDPVARDLLGRPLVGDFGHLIRQTR